MTDEPNRPAEGRDPTGAAVSDDPERAAVGGSEPAQTAAADNAHAAETTAVQEPVAAEVPPTDGQPAAEDAEAEETPPPRRSALGSLGRFVREIVIIVAVALIASALLRAFVVQAFFVPSGSMLPTIQLHDRILVSRIGDIDRGEVVVFEDPGNWIPAGEQAAPPSGVRKALEFIGVLPASGHEHLVKRVIGLPGDRVICCENGKLVINGVEVDESSFIKPGDKKADNVSFDVLVPKDSIFVLGDNRYVSGDSSRHPNGQEAFVPMDLVTGRAFAVIWPSDNIQVLHIPSAYDDVPDGQAPPEVGTFTQPDASTG